MADYNSSLPIRTENNGDVVAKIADATLPSQQLKVNADGSIDTNVSATDLDIRNLSATQDNVAISDGSDTLQVNADGSINSVVSATDLDIRDLAFATDKVDVSGSSVSVSATDLDIRDLVFATDKVDVTGSSVTVSATDLDIRDLAFATDKVDVSGSNVVISATDLDIRDLSASQDSVKSWIVDESGNPFSETNPLPIYISENEGSEVNDFNTASSVAASGSSNHDYTVTSGKTLYLTQIEAAASGKMKLEIQIESGVSTNTFNTSFVKFNSTANPNLSIILKEAISVAAGVRVRLIRTNLDNQSQNLYSTICGHEV